ncbi:MAG: LON peptidase substrate-binding domain-containing protein [Granulosicoccus sp.]|nr:LON peptidase substrate-binding domain-containing protein [Granulosicoccus sp.]
MTQLPLFPLSSLVMPDGLMPLRLFERRYLDMVSDSLKNNTGFGICLIKEGKEAGEPATPYAWGTHVKVVDFDQGKDGLLNIVAQGIEEFELLDFKAEDSGLLTGHVTLLPRLASEIDADITTLASKLDLILRFVEQHVSYPEKKLEDPEWVCSRLLELLPLDAAEKFRLLKLRTVDARLAELLKLNFKIESAKAF